MKKRKKSRIMYTAAELRREEDPIGKEVSRKRLREGEIYIEDMFGIRIVKEEKMEGRLNTV